MKHSPKYEMVKKFYKVYKVWSLDRVRDAVEKGWITEDEFKELTGEDYPDERRQSNQTHQPKARNNYAQKAQETCG